MSFTDRLEGYFRARPDVWIDGKDLATVAGGYGWRTRVSDLRKRGLVIENRQRIRRAHCDCNCGKSLRYTVSEYRYVPAVVAGPGDAHNMNQWDLR